MRPCGSGGASSARPSPTRSGVGCVEALVAETVTPAMDRSAPFHSAVNAAVRAGLTPDQLEEIMRQHPQGCASKYLHGCDRLREEIERSWTEAQQRQAEEAEAGAEVDRLNERYCVIQDGGKTLVLHFEPDVRDGRTRMIPRFMSFQDFRNFYLNKKVGIPDGEASLGHYWLQHPARRQYKALTFQPGGPEEIKGRLNL